MNETSNVFSSLGRQYRVRIREQMLNVREYGDPQGRPMFYFHGWPSSGSEAAMAHHTAEAVGVRLISPDRPGIGGSDFQDDRLITDWPPLLEALADALCLDRFPILAISGGAQYGYAAAHALPERIEALGVVCGALPLAELGNPEHMHPAYRLLEWMYRRNPRWPLELLRLIAPAAQLRWPRWMAWPLLMTLPVPDREALRIPFCWSVVSNAAAEAFNQGARAVYLDALPNIRPLGFSLADLSIPVHLWHGKMDRNFAWHASADVARRIPKAKFTLLERDGHFSLACRRSGEALATLAGL